jgi:hypothetical protein
MKMFFICLLITIGVLFDDTRSAQVLNHVITRGDKEVVCFIYHRFGDSRYPSTNTSQKDFESHLTYLKKNNFQMLTFSAAIDYLRSDAPVRKTAVITIDDGYKSFFRNGFPLLKKFAFQQHSYYQKRSAV